MLNWREQKRKMRRTLHGHMGTPALFLLRINATEAALITIRGPHTKRPTMMGNLIQDASWGERAESNPKLILDRSELVTQDITEDILNQAIISVEAGEAYRITNVLPHDDEWVQVEVVPLRPDECEGLVVPDNA